MKYLNYETLNNLICSMLEKNPSIALSTNYLAHNALWTKFRQCPILPIVNRIHE